MPCVLPACGPEVVLGLHPEDVFSWNSGMTVSLATGVEKGTQSTRRPSGTASDHDSKGAGPGVVQDANAAPYRPTKSGLGVAAGQAGMSCSAR